MTQADAVNLARMEQLAGAAQAPPPIVVEAPAKAPAEDPGDLVWPPRVAAQKVGKSVKTLRRWTVAFGIPHVTIGGVLQGYRPADLEQFIARHTIAGRKAGA